MFSRNVQVLPGNNEVVVELQPYIENVLRAEDPMFWQKLRCEIIFSIERNFPMTSSFSLHSMELKDFFTRSELPANTVAKVGSPVPSTSQRGGHHLNPALQEGCAHLVGRQNED